MNSDVVLSLLRVYESDTIPGYRRLCDIKQVTRCYSININWLSIIAEALWCISDIFQIWVDPMRWVTPWPPSVWPRIWKELKQSFQPIPLLFWRFIRSRAICNTLVKVLVSTALLTYCLQVGKGVSKQSRFLGKTTTNFYF